jgi:hypothetical protein
MYDSVTPSAIPTNAAVVAGYVDGAYAWSNADWARFPQAVKARIAVFPRTNDGHVLDVEQGDATPAQAPGWVTMRRTAGIDPIVYCNASTWPSVISAFRSASVAAPPYWIAQYDGNPAIPAGAVAKQYNDPPGSGGNYDISNASQAFINAVTGESMPLSQDDANLVASTLLNWYITTPGRPVGTAGRQVFDVLGDGERIEAMISAQSGAITSDEAALLAAIKAQPTGGQVDVQALANALAPVLAPLLPAGATPQQVGSAVVTALANHLAQPATAS